MFFLENVLKLNVQQKRYMCGRIDYHTEVFLYGLVKYDTVHMITTPPSFGTLGSLIVDISIASYSTTHFFYYSSLIYYPGKTAARDKPGGTAPASNGR